MRIFYKSFVIVILTVGAVQMSHAHRFYAAFSQIDLRDKTKTIEITHRLFTHDVDDFLRARLGNSSALRDGEIESILRDYVEAGFAIFDSCGNRLALRWVAMEYQVDSVHIYQEAKMPDDPAQLTLINRLFMDIFEDQKNTVNVEWGDKIRTNIFVKGNEQQKVRF